MHDSWRRPDDERTSSETQCAIGDISPRFMGKTMRRVLYHLRAASPVSLLLRVSRREDLSAIARDAAGFWRGG